MLRYISYEGARAESRRDSEKKKRVSVSLDRPALAVPHAASFGCIAKILPPHSSVPRFCRRGRGEEKRRKSFRRNWRRKNFTRLASASGASAAGTKWRQLTQESQPSRPYTMMRSQSSGADTMALSRRSSCVCPACKRSDGPSATTHA